MADFTLFLELKIVYGSHFSNGPVIKCMQYAPQQFYVLVIGCSIFRRLLKLNAISLNNNLDVCNLK